VTEDQAKVTQLSTRRSTDLWTDSDNDVDAADLGAGRRQRKHSDRQVVTRDVLQFAGGLAEEMVVIGRIGIEIRAARLDDDLVQEPGIGELMQGVVDRRERYRDPRRHRFAMQLLGSDVTFTVFQQEPCQSKALARWPEIHRTQALQGGRWGRRHVHVTNIG
jgi:hypothetical protein